MIRFAFLSVLVLLLNCVVVRGDAGKDAGCPTVWEVASGIQTPESICYDPTAGLVYVSNIGAGGPTLKDGDGFISICDLDGKLVNLKWITGLDAPKGMRVRQGTLWVSDIDRLVEIEIARGKIRTSVPVPNATFLNDVACGADGTVFVSDTMNSRILSCRDGQVSVFAEGDDLECPNGLLVIGDRLIVAAWGCDPAADFTTKVPGRLLSLDLKTKALQPISARSTGNLDGIASDGSGGYFATDWMAGKILHIAKDGTVKLATQLTKGTADLAYVPQKKLLIVPRMLENKVTALRWGE